MSSEEQQLEEDEGEVSQEVIDISAAVGDELFRRICEDWSDREDYDFPSIVFCLFINSIHALAAMGWTPDELAKEAVEHGNAELEPDEENTVN